ncbi:MAG: hypothetical protein CMJ89_20410 [Planctomycetes bacterium]|nr:hypothetical protein [Planctomycetota bacterium]|tara:strand:+ start:80 stop:3199 length:3120 start_codon:yes stop_codon:yes gene_type:complete
MRGGLQRWKRGVDSHGVRAAMAYALEGECDAARVAQGVRALDNYSAGPRAVTRFVVEDGRTTIDNLEQDQLRVWVDGCDPLTGERRGRQLRSPDADLVLDGTINAPKSFSIVTLLHPELEAEFEALQDRLRDRVLSMWQLELNARRGAGGRVREQLARVEVVELKHRRSRALDPHIHRHLWLNVRVLGRDGRWSNIDSRVAMKMHTLINAEGELAARTDPAWIAALARHGYSLDGNGEIAEVVQAVRQMSRRSNQIEKNRAVLLARWRSEHPGQEPGPDVVRQLDRLAWAQGRPAKPAAFDEAGWEQLVRIELGEIDASLLAPRAPVGLPAGSGPPPDIDLLAARAVVDADERSAAAGGRFSMFDIRAGATRAVAGSGLVDSRDRLQDLISAVVERAMMNTVDLLDRRRPAHVKGFMARATASLKVDLANTFDGLNQEGEPQSESAMQLIASAALDGPLVLDPGQACAAGAIAGSDRLVTITGPAGSGKTTTLRVARHALALQGREMVVVAPTKKAASVAEREIGATASSLHALLADHGWRWNRDEAGQQVWSRLHFGEPDPTTGAVYRGPVKHPLALGDRVVVDEAGMVDLHTATALAILAEETGIGIAMVGDHLQAMPVGHSGAMACMARRSGAVVELTDIHRFRDEGYAELTLQLREPPSREAALAVAQELDDRGLVQRVPDSLSARQAMVDGFFRWQAARKRVALVTSTNDEADAINEAIQEHRVETGQLRMDRIAIGQQGQQILEGDVVQTRRNDSQAGVDNRALWTVRRIGSTHLTLASINDAADTRTVSTDYAADHLHLAYASTVHGIQGETTDASIVGPGVDASGLYVGLTRGRLHNEAIVVARSDALARAALAESMARGRVEITMQDALHAARDELRRAALPPEELRAPNKRSSRRYANVEDLERLEATLRSTAAQLQRELGPLRDWLSDSEEMIATLEASHASASAAGHARDRATVEADATASVLAERRATRITECAAAEALLAEVESDLTRVLAEQQLRAAGGGDRAIDNSTSIAVSPIPRRGQSLGI